MATLPPKPQAVPPGESHQARQTAESFGENAELYDRTRPRYPQALVDAIIEASPGVDVLDVGVGTGVSARSFQATGARVLGIDPDARMAEFARRSGIDVEIATPEAASRWTTPLWWSPRAAPPNAGHPPWRQVSCRAAWSAS